MQTKHVIIKGQLKYYSLFICCLSSAEKWFINVCFCYLGILVFLQNISNYTSELRKIILIDALYEKNRLLLKVELFRLIEVMISTLNNKFENRIPNEEI